MIEKLKEHDVIDPKTNSVIGTMACDSREIMDKLNEVIDAVNKHEDIIRQIGEWGSSKGECLWCDTLTEFNPEKTQKETFVSIDEALKMGKNKNTQKPISLLDIYNEMGEMYSTLWNKIEDIRCELVHIQELIEPAEKD